MVTLPLTHCNLFLLLIAEIDIFGQRLTCFALIVKLLQSLFLCCLCAVSGAALSAALLKVANSSRANSGLALISEQCSSEKCGDSDCGLTTLFDTGCTAAPQLLSLVSWGLLCVLQTSTSELCLSHHAVHSHGALKGHQIVPVLCNLVGHEQLMVIRKVLQNQMTQQAVNQRQTYC